jgi:DNA-binding NtrC family response regulator
MNKVQILVIGRHEQIMQTVLRLLSQQEQWQAIGAITDEEAIEKFQQHHFDIVLLGGGVEEESEQKLCSLFTFQHPDIIIIQHYGGGSGLLNNEIQEALYKKAKENKPQINIREGLS